MYATIRDNYNSKGSDTLTVEKIHSPAKKRFSINIPSSWNCKRASAISPQATKPSVSLEMHYDLLTSKVTSISEKSLPFIGDVVHPGLKIYDIIIPAPHESRITTLKDGSLFLAVDPKERNPYHVIILNQFGDEIPALAFYEKRHRGKIGFLSLLPDIQLLFSTYAPFRGSDLLFLYIDKDGKIINIDRRFWSMMGYAEKKTTPTEALFFKDYVTDSDQEALTAFLEDRSAREMPLISNLPITFMKEDGSLLHATLSQTSLSPRELCIAFAQPHLCSTPSVDVRAEHLLSHMAAHTAAVFHQHYEDLDSLSTRGVALKDLQQQLIEAADNYRDRIPILPREIESDRSFLLKDFFDEIKTNLSLLSSKNVLLIEIDAVSSLTPIQGSKSILRKIIGSLIFKHFQGLPPRGQIVIKITQSELDTSEVRISLRSPVASSSLLSPTFIEAFHNHFPPISQQSLAYYVKEKMNGNIEICESAYEPTEMESTLSFSCDWSRRSSKEIPGDLCTSLDSTLRDIPSLENTMRITSLDRTSTDGNNSRVIAIAPASPVREIAMTTLQDPLPSLRILYAEDADSVRKMTASMLNKLQQKVTAVVNGEELLKALAEQGPFDLILSDIQMPKMNGDVAIQQARTSGCTLPAIGISGNASIEEIQEYKAKGMQDAYKKPITPQVLTEIITKYAPKKSAPIVIEELVDY